MQLTLQDTEIQSLGVNLREGTVVSIDRVKVVDAQKAYKVVPSDYQMYLRHDSIIQEINEGCSDMPSDRFYFKTFDQLPGLVNNIKYLTGANNNNHYFQFSIKNIILSPYNIIFLLYKLHFIFLSLLFITYLCRCHWHSKKCKRNIHHTEKR